MGYTGGNLSDLIPDAENITDDAVWEMVDDAGAYATEMASTIAPVGPVGIARPPGTLKASYEQIETHAGDPGVLGERSYCSGVESFDHVARWIEFGVAPHDVEAMPGHRSAFRSWPTGELVRVKRVHQKGFEGSFIVRRAIVATEQAFAEIAPAAPQRWKQRMEAAVRR